MSGDTQLGINKTCVWANTHAHSTMWQLDLVYIGISERIPSVERL